MYDRIADTPPRHTHPWALATRGPTLILPAPKFEGQTSPVSPPVLWNGYVWESEGSDAIWYQSPPLLPPDMSTPC